MSEGRQRTWAVIGAIAGVTAVVLLVIIAGGRSDETDASVAPAAEMPAMPDPAPVSSGPFTIDKEMYIIGERIFLTADGIPAGVSGQAAFLSRTNDTHYRVYKSIPFDGSIKQSFNQYFQPQLSRAAGYCDIGDLAVEWAVVFRGTGYESIRFAITDEILAGDERYYEPVC